LRNRDWSSLLGSARRRLCGCYPRDVEEENAPDFDLPKDAYFDASDIASDMRPTSQSCSKYTNVETRRPHAQLLECIVADQVNEAE